MYNINDTVTITPEGRSEADIPRLLAKPHMQKTMAAIREMMTFNRKLALRRAHMLSRAVEIFASAEHAQIWLAAPHPDLDELPPLALAHTDEQAARVHSVLDRIEFGIL